ncbi:predicted protein [Naegleria gruberi]|uniref:Predicted protein n=1 Tax=Naegleria gruberi TaxID=5762 RepID=D2V6X9_NAEGR|nr:uncharacterized protein NAEGRDRAFT_82503 [Naegleria gruberi]EFC47649.1 predicted protein [Naegleria gruberi]|eukprot:XP_002680393.1 predicted protein [Naegleria gruberi strain NEG-M]
MRQFTAIISVAIVLALAVCVSGAIPMRNFSKEKMKGVSGESLMVVPLQDYNNFYYYANVHFGSDKSNTFKLMVNTNGGLLTVTSTLCGMQCFRHPKYDSSKSSTYKKDGRQVDWYLGEFEFFGTLANDQMGLILDNGADLTIKNVTFAELVKSDDSFEESFLQFDGFLGLNLSPEPSANYVYSFPSIMDYVVQQKLVSSYVFSIYLSELKNPNQQKQKGKGALVLGGYSTDYYKGPMNFYPIPTGSKNWMIEFDGLKVNGNLVNYLTCGPGTGVKCLATFDTSAYAMFTDPITFSAMQLFANVSLPADCSQIQFSRIPTFTFVIGGNEYSIEPHNFVIENKPPIFGPSVCQGGINKADQLKAGQWIFGSLFQSLFYTVYDKQNMRIGLANAIHN